MIPSIILLFHERVERVNIPNAESPVNEPLSQTKHLIPQDFAAEI